eukprot:1324671-Amorphochlora_amoeboformis.AAC.1
MYTASPPAKVKVKLKVTLEVRIERWLVDACWKEPLNLEIMFVLGFGQTCYKKGELVEGGLPPSRRPSRLGKG